MHTQTKQRADPHAAEEGSTSSATPQGLIRQPAAARGAADHLAYAVVTVLRT
ncbi:hypothetical protein [Nonomuraea sp. NPDC050540]|uniref:hypothetical protein n=1 Tax=Nonomuraea sp. NPDC050540 TaxID=3364367 RepID=UPI0037B82E75